MAHDNTNRGAIWKNDDKREDSHPDFKGSLNVDGVEYWVSAWKRKEGASSKAPALSFSVKPKEMVSTGKHSYSPGGKVKREDPISTGRPRNEDMSDDIPF
jgi:hypothetical protein